MSELGTNDTWTPTTFFKAVHDGAPIQSWGYQWRGLVLSHAGWAGRRTDTRWTLIHVGSGAPIVSLVGNVMTVMPVAGEIAQATDWTLFDLPQGWRQTDPELPAKIVGICAAHPQAKPDIKANGTLITDEDAKAVIVARENAVSMASGEIPLRLAIECNREGDFHASKMRESP